MKPLKILILIANSEWALLIHLEENKFKVIEEREHPESKEKVEHLVSDRPGRTFSRVSTVRHALGEGQDVLNPERQKFARELLALCEKQYQLDPFHELWIITGPKFLGELRHCFYHVHKHPYTIREISKELSHHEPIDEKMHKIHRWIYGDDAKRKELWKSA